MTTRMTPTNQERRMMGLRPIVSKKRRCLKCHTWFKSKHYYCCPLCRESNQNILQESTEDGALYGYERDTHNSRRKED